MYVDHVKAQPGPIDLRAQQPRVRVRVMRGPPDRGRLRGPIAPAIQTHDPDDSKSHHLLKPLFRLFIRT